MKLNNFDYFYLGLPLILWPLSFIVLSNYFIYAMSASTFILATLTLLKHKELIILHKNSIKKTIIVGIIGAVILYIIFLLGYYLSILTGNVIYVKEIYSLIYSQANRIALIILLAVIGISEEIYWRSGVQGIIRKKSKLFRKLPWLGSSIFYGLIHISTLNPVLVLAAFFVGLITSIIAEKYGILGSSIVHVAWIEAIIIFLPVIML